jgi:uncharacterized LabA/DUF88 family protein
MSSTATLIQIDAQNLFYAARRKGDQRVDFEKIWEYFHLRESEFLTDAVIYMVRSPDFDTEAFEAKLKGLGYTLRIKRAVKVMRGKKPPIYRNTNHDLNIAVEAIDRINSYDKLILMSGDGDFTELCGYLKNRGKQIEIWSFRDCYNMELDRYADRTHMIEDYFLRKSEGDSISLFNFYWGGPKGQENTNA